jgi:hypothetical protein
MAVVGPVRIGSILSLPEQEGWAAGLTLPRFGAAYSHNYHLSGIPPDVSGFRKGSHARRLELRYSAECLIGSISIVSLPMRSKFL